MYNFLIIRKYTKGIPQQHLIRTRTILRQCFPIFATTPIDIQNSTLELEGSWYLIFAFSTCRTKERVIGCALVQDKLLCNVSIFPTFQGKGYGSHMLEYITNSKKNLSVYIDNDELYERRASFYNQFNLNIKKRAPQLS